MFQIRGTPLEAEGYSRVLLNISFRVPSKEALPPGRLRGVPSERDAPFLEPFFIYLSKYPVYEPSPDSRFPNGDAMERDARHQSLLLYDLQGPQ